MTAKTLVYRMLRGSRLTRFARARDRAVIFCFHNVVPDAQAGRGDASLHLPLGRFAEIVDFLDHAYDVVPLAEIVARVRSGRPISRLVALTFDDAYVGVFRHALPLLAERALPSTVFVVPSKADAPAGFWWDLLAIDGVVTTARREACLTELAGDERRILDGRSSDAHLPDAMLPAPWDVLRGAVGPVTFGSHSLRHLNLTQLAAHDLARDLVESRERLNSELSADVDLLTYPYGKFDAAVRDAAAGAGYSAAASMRYGLVLADCDPLALPRVNVPAGADALTLESWSVGWRLRKPA